MHSCSFLEKQLEKKKKGKTHFSLLIHSLCLFFSEKGPGEKRNDKNTNCGKKKSVQQFPLILGVLDARRNSAARVSQGQIPT